jgi:hypothetical protein
MRKLMMGGGEDNPKAKKTYQSQAEINAANAFARDFAKKQNLMFANEMHVADQVGDPVVQFRTLDGKPYTPAQMPASMIKKVVPDWVEKLEWNPEWQMPYYLDGNDMVYVDKRFYNSDRFITPEAKQKQIMSARNMGMAGGLVTKK